MPSRYHWKSQRLCKCRNSCIFLDNITKSYWPLWFSLCIWYFPLFSSPIFYMCMCTHTCTHPIKTLYKLSFRVFFKKVLCVCQRTYAWNSFWAENGRHCINWKTPQTGQPLVFVCIRVTLKTPWITPFFDYSIQRYFLQASSGFLRACATLMPVGTSFK